MKNTLFSICILSGAAILGATLGCQSLNESRKNDRFWFPSIQEPGHLNPNHERYTPEGSDPFPDATIGPRSLQMRPYGYDLPRAKAVQVNQTKPVEIKYK